MKYRALILLICVLFLSACTANAAPATEPHSQIGNPWRNYDSMAEAIDICGLAFPLPEKVGDFTADSYRVMNAQLLEVIYRFGEDAVIVRMQAGENLDLSGVYMDAVHTETIDLNGASVTIRQLDTGHLYLISKEGYSYSLYAPNGYQNEADRKFLSFICKP